MRKIISGSFFCETFSKAGVSIRNENKTFALEHLRRVVQEQNTIRKRSTKQAARATKSDLAQAGRIFSDKLLAAASVSNPNTLNGIHTRAIRRERWTGETTFFGGNGMTQNERNRDGSRLLPNSD